MILPRLFEHREDVSSSRLCVAGVTELVSFQHVVGYMSHSLGAHPTISGDWFTSMVHWLAGNKQRAELIKPSTFELSRELQLASWGLTATFLDK